MAREKEINGIKGSKWGLLLFLGAMLTLVAPSDLSQGVQPLGLVPPDVPIPKALFGMHIHHMLRGAEQPTTWPTIAFGNWRLWDAYVTWSDLEPVRGRWNFVALDRYVDLAEKHHVELLITLGWSPQWASARPEEKGYGPPGAAAGPKEISDWQEYVETIGTRYKGKICNFEIWNEPNSKGFYAGTIRELVELSRVAYRTLKKINPEIIVSSPPGAGTSSLGWLDQYLKVGGGEYADVIGYHFYVNPAPPERMVRLVGQVRQIMRDHGVGNKPLWDTETGWAIQDMEGNVKPAPGHGFNSVVLSDDLAAAYLCRAYILAWASGVSRLYWYSWDNAKMGLVERDGMTLKAPAIAYGIVEKWLVGATMTSCGSNTAGIWICALARPNNYRAWIVWDPARTVSFLPPDHWKVKEVSDLSGGIRIIRHATEVEIGPSPLLLVSSGRDISE